jgi:hypothetical protein
MILETQLEPPEQPSADSDPDLRTKLLELLSSHSPLPARDFYLQAQMDTTTSFKLELSLQRNYLKATAHLLYTNGRPIVIPELYREMTANKLKPYLEGVLVLRFAK